MASLRSCFLRLIIKHLVGAKFKRASSSIAELRKLDEFIIKNQKIPTGTEITPVRDEGIAAEWVRAPAVQKERAVLYLHGGALVMCSPATHRELAARLSAITNAAVLVLDYRLAPEYPFPAAMQDAVWAYRWLLDKGYSEGHLVIGGDSAGGGLGLQTLIALRDEKSPLPAAAFFLSPVTDWVRFDGESYSTRCKVDPLNTPEMCRFTASHYVGGSDPETPLLSPANMDLSGLPPLCIHVGDREILLSDSVRLAERAHACRVDVEFKIWASMWHVFQTSARFVPEARQSLNEIGRFVVNHVG
jgi:monoterpene epsilon-lactone hydrolase